MESKNYSGKDLSGEEKVIMSFCNSHCGGGCLLKVHVKVGVITRIETDDGEEPQLRACLKGRAQRKRVFAPDRLQFPMKRVGARGEGKFERISWDEALDRVAAELLRVKETYGPSAVLCITGVGHLGLLHRPPLQRLLNKFGGCAIRWGSASAEGSVFASRAIYGTLALAR